MELKTYKEKAIRIAPIPVTYLEDGKEKTDTLMVKYRPLTNEWFNSYERVQKKIAQLREDGLGYAERLTKEETILLELQNQLVLIDGESDDTKKVLQEQIDAQINVVEKEKAGFENFLEEASVIQKNMMAEQLLPILIDLGFTDNGNPVKITLEILAGLDFELLLDIGEAIQKKTFRNKKT